MHSHGARPNRGPGQTKTGRERVFAPSAFRNRPGITSGFAVAGSSVRRGSPDQCGEHLRLRGTPGGSAGRAGLTPATQGSWPHSLGWLGSSPKGDAPRSAAAKSAQTPGFHSGCRLKRCSPQWSPDPADRPDRRSPTFGVGPDFQSVYAFEPTPKEGDLRSGSRRGRRPAPNKRQPEIRKLFPARSLNS